MTKRKHFQALASALVFMIFAGSLTSCQTLRKKFTREKKKKVSGEIIPVLEPVDYPFRERNPEERYLHHYTMWQVWQKDLERALRSKESEKRLKYLLAQAVTHLEGMRNWLSAEGARRVDEVIKGYRDLDGRLNQPDAFKDYLHLARQADRLGKSVRIESGGWQVKE
jgi:hypothetical protein